MTCNWREYAVSADGTHHVHLGRPAYERRFVAVLKFHAPGLAPVIDDSGTYHITSDGNAAYDERHVRTFGFYEGIAAAHSPPRLAPYPARTAHLSTGNATGGVATSRRAVVPFGTPTAVTSTSGPPVPRPTRNATGMPAIFGTATPWCRTTLAPTRT